MSMLVRVKAPALTVAALQLYAERHTWRIAEAPGSVYLEGAQIPIALGLICKGTGSAYQIGLLETGVLAYDTDWGVEAEFEALFQPGTWGRMTQEMLKEEVEYCDELVACGMQTLYQQAGIVSTIECVDGLYQVRVELPDAMQFDLAV